MPPCPADDSLDGLVFLWYDPGMNSAKIAISLPVEVLRKVERLRKETGESRSALIRKAIERVFADREKAKRALAYIEGYRKYPDAVEDRPLTDAQVAEVIAKDPWE